MKRPMGRLLVAGALALASISGATTAFPTTAQAAVAEQPWATIAYLRNGQLVGGAALYCDRVETWGDTSNYDQEVYEYFYMCP